MRRWCLAVVLYLASTLALAEGGLVAFDSAEGQARLTRTTAKADFPALARHFEAQSNGAFCGPTSAAIVLNAMLPPGAAMTVRHTQDSVVARGAKPRAQVLGQPVAIGGQVRPDFGYQLAQFDELLRANGARTRKVVVGDTLPAEAVKADLIGNLRRTGDYVVVNYLRRAVGQSGGGHISPLAAYDADSDSFLVLDVNPAVARWTWLPAADLIRGMRTYDTVENRGYVLIAEE